MSKDWLEVDKSAPKAENRKWEDCPRIDLSAIPKALAKGWTPEFDYLDKHYNRIIPENPPINPVSFIKGQKHCWKCMNVTKPEVIGGFSEFSTFWRVADLINGYYCNHRTYADIDLVLEKE